jgi:hypothetical protein
MHLVSKEHIGLVKKEWTVCYPCRFLSWLIVILVQKKELHRDVRITILQEATALLKNKKMGDMAWSILDTAVDTPNPEIQIAILGITSIFLNNLC